MLQVMVTSLQDQKYLEYISRILNSFRTIIEQLSNNNQTILIKN